MSYERMKAMFTIVGRGEGIALTRLFARRGVQLHLQIAAFGTASSELLSVLGLNHSERDILISFAPESRISALLDALDDDYRGLLRVRGISFSLPLSGISKILAKALNNPFETTGGANMTVETHPEKEYSLILVTVNHGYTDLVMQTACKAGATGGTVIRGRFVGADHLEQFYGITLQEEREILVIACNRDNRNKIMEAITEAHGMNTQQQVIICSLPIDRLVRLT